jgi:hypothetical protein
MSDTFSIGYRPYEMSHTVINDRTGFAVSVHDTRSAALAARAAQSVTGTDPLFPSFAHDPEIDHGFDDDMFDGDDDPDEGCSNKGGHEFVCSGTAYGGDDESYHGEGRCYCQWCGADGDA